MRMLLLALIPLILAAALPAAESIHNDQYTVTCDKDVYTIQATGQGKPFATGRLASVPTALSVVTLTDPDYGPGTGIKATLGDSGSETIQLYSGSPFVLFSSTMANTGKEATVLNKVPIAEVDVEFDAPAKGLVSLGTGGLCPLEQNMGSYAWLAIADPATRHGLVGGWLTHEHGSGIVLPKTEGGKIHLSGRVEYGHLRVEAGKTATSETFVLGWFADARLGMEKWADAVAKRLAIKLPPMPIVYCTWYDNQHGGSGDEKSLAELSAFAAKNLVAYGMTTVQIDDGWQLGDPQGNGPRKNFSAFNPMGPYPSGMKATADNIHAGKLTAGLWLLPFGGNWNDPFFASHQDWFVKRQADGKPFDTQWGGTSLDMTQPGARAFVSGEVKQATHDWGYGYLKIDGLYTGIAVKQQYVNDQYRDDEMGDAVFHDQTKTNIEVFRSGLRLVREAAGRATFILGCCAPQNMRSYAGVFGLVDAMRMGPDNSGTWEAWLGASPQFGSRNYHLNGRIWWSDPDPTYVRASIPLDQARCMASWNAITGQMISLSDWLPALPPERLDIIRRVIPGHGATARPLDLFSTWPPRQWLVTDARADRSRRDVLGLFNWTDKPEDVSLPLADSGLPAGTDYVAFDFWNNVFVKPFTATLAVNVPAASCRILAIRPLLPHPFLLSTSRHVSQGIIDVTKEDWKQATSNLEGTSAVVGGDPYELRVVARTGTSVWSAITATVSPADATAGVTITSTSNNGLIRATITSPLSREVAWSLHFAPARQAQAALEPVANPAWKLAETNDLLVITWKAVDGCDCEVDDGSGTPVLSTTGNLRLTNLTSGKEIHVSLTAVDWSGRRSKPTVLTVKVPKFAELGPVPPKPNVSITSLTPVESRTGYGNVNRNHSVDNNGLTVGGATYADGMGVHAESLLAYDVKPEYHRFVAVVGIDDEVKNSVGAIRFKLEAQVGDSTQELAASPKLLAAHAPAKWHFDVAIPEKCTRLRLLALAAGDDNRCDHADWVDAGFITESGDKK